MLYSQYLKDMNKIYRRVVLSTLLIAQPVSGFGADVNNMFGVWGSITLRGNFNAISPKLEKFNWFIMNQTRTRDDSPEGSRFTENILFSQVGYRFNEHASLWLGYAHDWINPLDKPSIEENRAYQDLSGNKLLVTLSLSVVPVWMSGFLLALVRQAIVHDNY